MVATQALEHVAEQRIRLAVVEGDVRRRPDDDEDVFARDADVVQDSRVRYEPVQVVLLLQSRIAANLRGVRAEPVQAVLWDRVRNDDPVRRAAAESVLDTRELVVEGVRGRDAERARDHRQFVRGVREGDVEAAAPRVAAQRTQPTPHGACFAEGACAAVPRADHLVLDSVEREQLGRLGVLTRRHVHVVAPLEQQCDQGSEERHLRRVRDVDPGAHAGTLPARLHRAD